ncbi:MAG: hypothetical protein RG741_06625 [Bacteroidales bacterium]|nr:hypothetical protein [Bacteroidales bacterium]
MENNTVVERYLEVTKEEPLSTLDKELTLDNTCVLESTSPYFGYYQDEQLTKPDPFIYCVLDEYYSLGDIARVTAALNEKRRQAVDVAIGSLYLLNKTCPVLRVKNINQYHIEEIQTFYRDAGIRFKKRKRNIKNQMGVIRVFKFEFIKQLDPGLYTDANDETKGYFRLPKFISWSAFKSLTEEAKYETSILYFDAALALLYDKGNIVHLTRIYKRHMSQDQLKAIRDRYYTLLK